LDRRRGGYQYRSGHSGEEKNSKPLPELELQIIQPIAQRYTAELSWLLYGFYIVTKIGSFKSRSSVFDSVYCGGRIPKFRTILLPPSSPRANIMRRHNPDDFHPEDGSSKIF
jgi:hypothetical protein